MVWPFLAVLLFRQFHLSATIIGVLLSLATICGAISSIYTGWLSDSFGRIRLILCGTTLSALAFGLLSYGHYLVVYVVGVTCVSVGTTLLESSCKALIGDRIRDKDSRELALYCRYYAINAGAASGPLLGVTLGVGESGLTFLITAIVYFTYGVMLWLLLESSSSENGDEKHSPTIHTTFSLVCGQMFRHKQFAILLLCNMLAALVYANFDSTLVQYLTRSGVPSVMVLIATLIAINTLTIVVMQFPLLRIFQRFSNRTRLVAGLLLMLHAQLLFAFSPVSQHVILAVATVVLSLGELVVFPTFSVEVDHITPDTLRGSYFGASNLYLLGTAIAPLYGGFMLDNSSPEVLFLGLAGLCILIVGLLKATNETKQANFVAKTEIK